MVGQNDRAMDEAQAAAERWVALVDAGDYAAAWDQAASLMKSHVDAATLEEGLRKARGMFGALSSRTVSARTYATELPGAPDGEYVVITTDASFEHKRGAVETITPAKEPDGTWRVSGYFIR